MTGIEPADIGLEGHALTIEGTPAECSGPDSNRPSLAYQASASPPTLPEQRALARTRTAYLSLTKRALDQLSFEGMSLDAATGEVRLRRLTTWWDSNPRLPGRNRLRDQAPPHALRPP